MGWIKYVPSWLSFLFVCCWDGQPEVGTPAVTTTWKVDLEAVQLALCSQAHSHPQSWNSLWIQDSAAHLNGKPGVQFQVWSLAIPLAQDLKQKQPVNKAASRPSGDLPAGQPPHMTWCALKNRWKTRKTWEGWNKSETQNTSENKTPLWFIRVNKQKLKTPEESRNHDSNTQIPVYEFSPQAFLWLLLMWMVWNSAWHFRA